MDKREQLKKVLLIIIIPIFIGLFVNWLSAKFSELTNDIENLLALSAKVEQMEKDIVTIREDILALKPSNDNNNETPSETSDSSINIDINIQGIRPTNNNALKIYQKSEYIAYAAAPPSWESSDVIAINPKTGQEYTATELIDQKILLSYEKDNKEYYFYGQYNENNQWDGNCITNVYEGNNLISIMDAEYQNGEVKEYKQVIKVDVSSGKVWAISDRVNKIDNITDQIYTSGETWNYFYNNCEYIKTFDIDNVSNKDIITISDFKDYIIERTSLEGYYNGRTFNGLYNDKTGTAYMVRYFEDGTVRTLYVGKFIDGYPNDMTDNAWSIAYSIEGGYYTHNTKGFENGNAIKKSTDPINIDEINEIISKYNFNCDLNWKQDYVL